jgi:ParB family chromosome partitioning protein
MSLIMQAIGDDFPQVRRKTRSPPWSNADSDGTGISPLELRYEFLRIRRPEHERRMLVSLDEVGQQVPIVVVQDVEIERYVVIDGHKRLRALRRLGRDAIAATCWDHSEAEALVVSRLVQTGESETALEQSWLLAELRGRFGRSMEELARQFQRSKSWISRRLALVDELPASLQERVRCGELTAHIAEKYLVPLVRANREACLQLVEALVLSFPLPIVQQKAV